MSEERRPRKSSDTQASQVASRTPIAFGTAVEQVFRTELLGYEQAFAEVTSEFLLFGYRREARENQNFFILVQGARFSGRVSAEVAVSRSAAYPYYRFFDEPRLGVGGFRERVPMLMTGQDHSQRYGSQEELLKTLRDLVVGQGAQALRALTDVALPELHKQQQTWHPLFLEWQEAEAAARPRGGRRYPGLPNELEAGDMLQELLLSRKFDGFLGPLKFRYRDPRFFHCHLYLFARGLEFLVAPAPAAPAAEPQAPVAEAPEGEAPPRMVTWADILGPPPKKKEEEKGKPELPPPLGDPIAGITGRQPQEMALELSQDPQVRHQEFAFLRALATVEAFYEEKTTR